MTRRLLILLFCLSPFAADTTKVQLQSITIEATTNIDITLQNGIGCGDIKYLEFCSYAINVDFTKICYGNGLTNKSDQLALIVSAENNATVNKPEKIEWKVGFEKNVTGTEIVWEQTFTGDLANPEKDNIVTTSSTEEETFNKTTNSTYGNIRLTFKYMTLKTETVTENKNTQAVVVAVLEGLILGAILVLFIYRQCFVKQKQQRTAATGGFSGPGANVGTPAARTNYYDNAAVAYRQNNTTRNESYGYDQPPIRLEDRTRSTEQTRPSETTNGRVETDSPSLVPVPLDPLTQWNDNRNGTTPDRLFS